MQAVPWTTHHRPVWAFVLVLTVVCACLLAAPGETVTTRYLPDLFLILDGAHRIGLGQVPSADFHTPLGPLAFYVPGVGYALSGTFGGAMPTGMALVMLALAPAIAHGLASRLRPLLALFFGAFLVLLVAAPINLGEGVTALSFAKFYNRIGWVAIAALLVMHLRPYRPSDWTDALCAAFLTLAAIYTKATYGVAAFAFLVLLLLDSRQRRWAAIAIGLCVASATLVELIWQSSLSYAAALRLALEVSGALRGSWGQITDHVLVNFADYVLVALFAGLALWTSPSLRDAVFYGFCGVVGFLLVNQNFQSWGIVTLHAAAAVAAETILRSSDTHPRMAVDRPWLEGGAKLLLIALVLPTTIHCALALGLHSAAAIARAGEPIDLPAMHRVRLANLWTWGDHEAATQYLSTVRDGVAALGRLQPHPERLLVLDIANPFSASLGLAPAEGDSPWLQWDRTVNASWHRPGDALLSDVQIVMEPKVRKPPDDARGAKDDATPAAVYAAYLSTSFELATETEHWKVHRRVRPLNDTGCPIPCSGSDVPASRHAAPP